MHTAWAGPWSCRTPTIYRIHAGVLRDVVTDNPLKGAKALLDLLRAESNWLVVRAGARGETPSIDANS